MDVLEILSAFSCLMTVIGLWLLGNKNKNGFLIFTLSLIAQTYIFYVGNNGYLVVQMLILITFNIINYFKWKWGEEKEC